LGIVKSYKTKDYEDDHAGLADDQFMFQVLNILTNEYKLQMLLFKKADWSQREAVNY
jgi:hypothetical protein